MNAKERAYNGVVNTMVTFPAPGAVSKQIVFEDARLLWTNFMGRENQFGNSATTFNVVVPDAAVQELLDRGFRVREYPVSNEDGDDRLLYILNIKVNMSTDFPPEIILHTEFRGKRSRRRITNATLGELDRLQFERVDLIINPYNSKNNPGRVTAYLNKLSAIQEEVVDFGAVYDDWLDEDENFSVADENDIF